MGEEPPNIEWQRCIGGTQSDVLFKVVETHDGGALLLFRTDRADGDFIDVTGTSIILKMNSDGYIQWKQGLNYLVRDCRESPSGDIILCGGDSRIGVSKLRSDGTIEWDYQYPDARYGFEINFAEDGGFIVIGEYYRYKLIKLDSQGNIFSQEEIGTGSIGGPCELQSAPDGGQLFLGNEVINSTDVTIKKIDSNGNIDWDRSYGGRNSEGDIDLNRFIQNSGGYAFSVSTTSNDYQVSGNHGDSDIWYVSIDQQGDLIQQKCFGGSGSDSPIAIFQMQNNNLLILGITNSRDGDLLDLRSTAPMEQRDLWVLEILESGSIVNQKCYNSQQFGEITFSEKLSDDSLLLLSNTNTGPGYHGQNDILLSKVSPDGTIQWQKCYGGSGDERSRSIVHPTDGGYVLTGLTTSNDGDVSGYHQGIGWDGWIVRVGDTALLHPLVTSVEPLIFYSYSPDEKEITIYGTGISSDTSVKIVKPGQSDIIPSATQFFSGADRIICRFNLNGKSSGYYNIVVQNPNGAQSTSQNTFKYIIVEPTDSKWDIEQINESGSIQGTVHFQLDQNQNPHIVYISVSPSGSYLKHVWKNVTGWHQQNFRKLKNSDEFMGPYESQFKLDKSGIFHIILNAPLDGYDSDTGQLKYLKITSDGNQEITFLENGWNCDLALDSNGNPHLVYLNQSHMYTYFDGVNWHTESTPASTEMSIQSLAIDSMGNPRIAFSITSCGYYGCSHNLYYYVKDTSGWHSSTISGIPFAPNALDLVLDDAQNPKIVYDNAMWYSPLSLYSSQPTYCYEDKYYRWNQEKLWNQEHWSFCQELALSLDQADNPHIANLYQNCTSDGGDRCIQSEYDIIYEFFDGIQWKREIVDNTEKYFQSLEFELDPNNNPHFVYSKYDNGNYSVLYTKLFEGFIPNITFLSPSTVKAGSDGFTLEVTGTNFIDGATILWNGDERPTVFVSDTQLNATILKEDVAIEGTFFVAVKNPDGNESEGFTFEVTSPLSTKLLPPPTLLSPGELTGPGPTINNTTPSFTWSGVPGADGYGLYIRDLDSNILVFDSQSRGITIAGTRYDLSPGILENGKQYRWNMNTHSLSGWGNYSERLYFKAPIPSTLLDPPVLLSPGTDESPGELSDLTPTFSWTAVPNADKYGLYISDITEGEDNPDLIFNSQARGIVLEGTSFDELPVNILQKGKKYRWNMNSHNDSGWGIPNTDRFYFYTPAIEPSEIPVADFTINPPSPVTDWTVVLDASESYSPVGGIITKYIWRIDNGMKFESFAPIHYYKFQDVGAHEIELSVLDDKGIASEVVTSQINVWENIDESEVVVHMSAPLKSSNLETKIYSVDVRNQGQENTGMVIVQIEYSPVFELIPPCGLGSHFYKKERDFENTYEIIINGDINALEIEHEIHKKWAYWIIEDLYPGEIRHLSFEMQIKLDELTQTYAQPFYEISVTATKESQLAKNAFYPGIGWTPSITNEDGNDRLTRASGLDAIRINSYYETNDPQKIPEEFKQVPFDLRGALHTYLAYLEYYTNENYVDIEYQNGKYIDGHYDVVFSHSGGTQTLYQKLKTGKVTADYAFFVAPALITEENLKNLIKNGNVKKKIFIIQSNQDMIYNIHIIDFNKNFDFDINPLYQDIHPGINAELAGTVADELKFIIPFTSFTPWVPDLHMLGPYIDIESLLEGIDQSQLPDQTSFWIGGANRQNQELFVPSDANGNGDVNGDSQYDINTIDLSYRHYYHVNPLDQMKVHSLLIDWTIDHYIKKDTYPFNGSFENLGKYSIPSTQSDKRIISHVTAHDPNEKYGPEGHHPADEPLHYTVEYENEGDGSAFGVYVTDSLDPSLDESTLEISPMYSVATGQQITERGIYFPENRTVYWDVGTVPPGEGGHANISVKFLSTVPDGTFVTNYATVYFPSAFEETQTNTIVTIKGINIPPEIPNLTYPGNNAVDISVNGSLFWEGHDPNNESLMYDVYLGTSIVPPLVIENTTLNMYYYSELEENTPYYWKVVAKDPYDGVTSSEISQFITEIPYRAYFTSNRTMGQVPLTIQFTDNSTGNITSRFWSFGDGTVAENVTVVTHTYTQKGTYSVNLTVSGIGGEDTMTQVIHVLPSQSVSPSYIVCWGNNISGQCEAPGDNDYIALSGGDNHSVALRSNGSLVAWGENMFDQCTVPSGTDYIAIDSGNSHNLALKSDGSLAAWGSETTVPPGNDFIAVAAGSMHSLALRSNGTIVAWGYDGEGACNVPDEHDFVAIAAGRHSLALRSNGSLVAWGDNSVGECNVPPGNDFIAIAANSWHSLALRSNGSLTAWGFNMYNQCTVPPGNDFKAISAGFWHSLALKENGSVVAWGYNEHGECEVPQGMTFEHIAAGDWHNLALTSMHNTITVTSPNGGENWTQGSTQTLRWNYTGDPGSSVRIEVVKGTAVRVIAQNISIGSDGSGSFNFTFPYSTPLGSDYLVRITSISNATCTDTSDAPFAIIPPITVLSPNGGEEWQQGSTQTINWHYTGDPGPLVKIEALRGNTVMAVITPGIPVGSGGSGSMNLTLPINTPLGSNYRIRISSPSNSTYSDTSDSYFSVIPNTSAIAESYVFDLTWGREGSGDGQFHYPIGVAVDTAGNVYVADTGNYRIQKFSPTGTFITKWGSVGSGVGQFNVPHGIAVDSIGNVYITDANNHRIQKFNSTGSFITKWGEGPGSGDGQFNVPYGVAVDSAGNVYVADSFNHRIQKFNSTGSFITKWGEGPGSGDGQFNVPYGVAVDSAGNVYVADAGNRRIQKFNSAGSFITKWGEGPGSDDGQFSDPYGVATDNAGNVYVADAGNRRIQKFNSAGSFITKWGEGPGSDDGQFDYPECVAVDSEGNVYVGDYYNHRIQKFHFSTICVILPNGGENWIQGSTQTIQWNYTGNRGPAVKIEALRGDKVLAVVTPSTPIGSGGSGSYNLTLPYNTPLGSDYLIRITSTSNSAWTDMSDDPFTVSSAIQMVSPNGGENWIKGSTYPITWTYSGNPGPTVKIEALRGEAVLATIASSYPLGSDGEGSYNLTLPLNTPLGNDYRFRITSTSYPRCTYTSEDPFTISG